MILKVLRLEKGRVNIGDQLRFIVEVQVKMRGGSINKRSERENRKDGQFEGRKDRIRCCIRFMRVEEG